MKKYIIYILAITLLVFVGINIKNNLTNRALPEQLETIKQNEEVNESIVTQDLVKSTNSIPLKTRIWNTVLDYKEAAKKHDLDTISALAYKVSQTCTEAKVDSSKEANCFAKLDSAFEILDSLSKEQFSKVLSDNKQAILISDVRITENEVQKVATQTYFYFILDNSGSPKVLGIDTDRSHRVQKQGKTSEQIDLELKEKMKDTDADGLEDILENCTSVSTMQCKKTNPNSKDTDQNGYWDSIDPLL